MSKTTIPQRVQSALWAKAGGRCQYRGCNENLVGDLVAGKEDGTFGFIAHVVADQPTGPRGHIERSPKLARSLENLMLMCAKHHKLIDVDERDSHSESLLLEMKKEHEDRIGIVCAIDPDRASHVIRFGADIGQNEALVSTRSIFAALPPDNHPAHGTTIDLELVGSAFRDHEPEYWTFQRTNLLRQFEARVKGRIERQEIRHLSVFALAPQPLLIELGRLLGDIVPVAVRQRHREPPTWNWQKAQPPVVLETTEPEHKSGTVALKLAVSATITDDRITSKLGSDVTIWSITAKDPHNDILRRAEDQSVYRRELRKLLERMKTAHGENALVHVFPALPASLAIETGRVRMPKADLPWLIYDQNAAAGGFIPTFKISAD